MSFKTAARFITFAAIVQILGYAYALPGHIGDPTWSDHAQFHLFLSWLWIVGLNIGILFITWTSLQQGDRNSLWALTAMYISAQGGHYIASLVYPAGRPDEWWYDYALGVGALIFALGLWMAWKQTAKAK